MAFSLREANTTREMPNMTYRATRKTYEPDELARALARMRDGKPAIGFIVGRTMLRDIILELLDCSPTEAEEAVDTLILCGKVMFVKPVADVGSAQVRAWTSRKGGSC
jgi:hypothetical protein